ncbi:aspartate ammonia-lyase [Fusibacter paucivorans]|uniref:aspartate ammonia-lyase n=1 Tax=Fusibacter paucivorans TaxID=76009 RepID=UPI0031B89F44
MKRNDTTSAEWSESCRTENDALGAAVLPSKALYGIHTHRARNNFNLTERTLSPSLIHAILQVKKACAEANVETGDLSSTIGAAIISAADKALDVFEKKNESLPLNPDEQEIYEALQTHPLQGGAGTSVNMNVNEVLANLALARLNKNAGDYDSLHPVNHVNMSQSTNDVYPTALKIALIRKVRKLSDALAQLQSALQRLETEHANVIKLGRTQLMDAVPITFGQVFGAYARAISRDRWRIYKAEERLREINLGGTAVGTGLNASLDFIYLVTERLQRITGLGIARADLLVDATQNADVYVEVSGLLKALATNLMKIANDLRLMNAGPRGGFAEISLEAHQAGSSIMPGKVNPVLCEMVNQVCFRVFGADVAITAAAAGGQFELNPFLPLIGDELFTAFDLLEASVEKFTQGVIETLSVNRAHCQETVAKSTSLAAAFIDVLGYDEASAIAKRAHESGANIRNVLRNETLLSDEAIDERLTVQNLTHPKR